jgi:hypothetical protein
VNNAAVFSDATLDLASPSEVLDLITANLALAVNGCHTAVNHYLAHSRAGAIVNVFSHQARSVRGALPYATAKAAVEGLTRAVAVDHGPQGIRTNAMALGSISTPRFKAYRADHAEVDQQMAALHPLGRVGTSREVGEVVAFLLSREPSFINGAILPVDGGRAVIGSGAPEQPVHRCPDRSCRADPPPAAAERQGPDPPTTSPSRPPPTASPTLKSEDLHNRSIQHLRRRHKSATSGKFRRRHHVKAALPVDSVALG